MRGSDVTTGSLFSYLDIEQRIPARHPLRLIRELLNDVLAKLDAEFGRLYEGTGRSSVAQERPLRASLLQRDHPASPCGAHRIVTLKPARNILVASIESEAASYAVQINNLP